jgi:hypothetical protein
MSADRVKLLEALPAAVARMADALYGELVAKEWTESAAAEMTRAAIPELVRAVSNV